MYWSCFHLKIFGVFLCLATDFPGHLYKRVLYTMLEFKTDSVRSHRPCLVTIKHSVVATWLLMTSWVVGEVAGEKNTVSGRPWAEHTDASVMGAVVEQSSRCLRAVNRELLDGDVYYGPNASSLLVLSNSVRQVPCYLEPVLSVPPFCHLPCVCLS